MKRLTLNIGYLCAILALVGFLVFGVKDFQRAVVTLGLILVSLVFILVIKIPTKA